MFRRMEKYHKAFLIFVVILIGFAFTVGPAFSRWFAARNIKIVAVYEPKKTINAYDFSEASSMWNALHTFAEKISPKAKKIFLEEKPQYYSNEYSMLYLSKDPTWDTIFSLKEEIYNLDKAFIKSIKDDKKWNSVLKGDLDIQKLELDYYLDLDKEKKKEIRRNLLSKDDILNRIILLDEAKSWQIRVTEDEIENFIEDTTKKIGGEEAFMNALNSSKIFITDFKKIAQRILTILKYVELKTQTVKVPMSSVYNIYRSFHMKYKINYAYLKPEVEKLEKKYEEEKISFFKKTVKKDKNYFKVSPVADFEYIYVDSKDFLTKVEDTTLDEARAYFSKNKNQYRYFYRTKEELEEKGFKDNLENIKETIKSQKALQKAEEYTKKLHGNIKGVSLKIMADQYKLFYQNKKGISEDKFSDEEVLGTGEAKKQLYHKLSINEISNVIASKDQGYFIAKLLKKTPARFLTQKEIVENDDFFLERYFYKNKKEFKKPKYKIAYVIADYDSLDKNVVVTTNSMKTFYEEYKGELYKKKSDKEKPEYIPFEEVKDSLYKKVENFLKIKELQKIHIIHQNYKKLGPEAEPQKVVEGLAKRIMLTPECIKYIASNKLQSKEEIEKENFTKDPGFINALPNEVKLSDVKNSSVGKYFYKVLEYKDGKDIDFKDIREEIKEHFIKHVAFENSLEKAKEIKKEFKTLYVKLKKNIDKNYNLKLKGIAEKEEKEKIEKEKIERLKNLPNDLFNTLCLKYDLKYYTSPAFENISEIKELKDFYALSNLLARTKPGELTEPVKSKESVLIAELLDKNPPEMSDIPDREVKRLYNVLSKIEYISALADYTAFDKVKTRVNLEKLSEEVEDYDDDID